jgi:S-adenosylmethionine:diacylglycerol 3-amino-3-carboxypropyl transferase
MNPNAGGPAAALPPIYFAQVREDSRLERELVREHGLRRVVCVASGGCTALSLLAHGVERVDAVDLNPAQIALVELKRAALARLPRSEYLAFVGRRGVSARFASYEGLRAGLGAAAQNYWNARRDVIELGINHCGVTEAFYRKVGARLTSDVVSVSQWRALIEARAPGERRRLHGQLSASSAFTASLRAALSRESHLEFYPNELFANTNEHEFGDFFARRFADEIALRPLSNNYFLSQLLFEEYACPEPDGCPDYLAPEGYERTRHALGNLHLHAVDLAAYLRGATGTDAVILSNVFDWAVPMAREQLARAVVDSAPGALVLWRQMLAEFPLPEAFRSQLDIDQRESERLTRLDRSFLYRSITVGRVRGR